MSRAADVGACMYRAKFARESLLDAIAHGADYAVVETLREESERADAAHARAVHRIYRLHGMLHIGILPLTDYPLPQCEDLR